MECSGSTRQDTHDQPGSSLLDSLDTQNASDLKEIQAKQLPPLQDNIIHTQESEVTEPTYDSINVKTNQTVKQVCLKHGKPTEAFCLFDRQLLCIDCILSEDHKGSDKHEIVSVAKATENEREVMEAKYKQSKEAQVTLQD